MVIILSIVRRRTINGITETLIITRPAGATLEKDSIKELSRYNATMAIYLGTHKLREIMDDVAYPRDTPAAVVYHASWDDEKIIRGTVGDIADRVEKLGIDRSAIAFERGLDGARKIQGFVGKVSVESIAKALRSRIVNRDSTKKVNTALLEKGVEVLCVKGPKILLVDDDVKCFASAALKTDEKGIIEAAASFGKEVKFVPHEIINSIKAPTSSKAKAIGLNGVCEPAALALSEEKELLLKKRIYGNVTIAIAR